MYVDGQLLTTDLASFVTGATIDVNGGAYMQAYIGDYLQNPTES